MPAFTALSSTRTLLGTAVPSAAAMPSRFSSSQNAVSSFPHSRASPSLAVTMYVLPPASYTAMLSGI